LLVSSIEPVFQAQPDQMHGLISILDGSGVEDPYKYSTMAEKAWSAFLLPWQDVVRTFLKDTPDEIEIPAYGLPVRLTPK